MAENSKIEWCDHTINFWWGCEKVSPGCVNCYAAAQSHRLGERIWGHGAPRRWVRSAEELAGKLNKRAAEEGVRYRVFANSMSDFFEQDHGQRIVWAGKVDGTAGQWAAWHRDDLGPCTAGQTKPGKHYGERLCTLTDLRRWAWRVIDANQYLDWILVTKRPENIRRTWCPTPWGGRCASFPDCGHPDCIAGMHRGNVWLLTSVSDQESADKQIPELLRGRDLSPVLGISAEPLLGDIDLRKYFRNSNSYKQWATGGGPSECPHGIAAGIRCCECTGLDWVIVGGESGPKARPMHPDWARSIRGQCEAAGVPFFFKQWGEWWPVGGTGVPPYEDEEPETRFTWIDHDGTLYSSGCEPSALMLHVGKKAAGALLGGREWRQFPNTNAGE